MSRKKRVGEHICYCRAYSFPHRFGGGRDFALAYMDTGMSSTEAVNATKKLDCKTGGEVKSYPINGFLEGYSIKDPGKFIY